jgi:hypothetical protein
MVDNSKKRSAPSDGLAVDRNTRMRQARTAGGVTPPMLNLNISASRSNIAEFCWKF